VKIIANPSELSRRYTGSVSGGDIQRLKDRHTQEDIIKIPPGGFYVTTEDNEVLTTILGSCVSACIRDPQTNVGGMNHFLLPEGDRTDALLSSVTRFGNYAMETVINEILARGGVRSRLEIKIFGGANMFESSMAIGDENVQFVETYLRNEGLAVTAKHVGGQQARRLHYWPLSGRARMLLLGQRMGSALVQDEQTYRRTLSSQPVDGGVDLFD
jgi:chemotaxis protein CheD